MTDTETLLTIATDSPELPEAAGLLPYKPQQSGHGWFKGDGFGAVSEVTAAALIGHAIVMDAIKERDRVELINLKNGMYEAWFGLVFPIVRRADTPLSALYTTWLAEKASS